MPAKSNPPFSQDTIGDVDTAETLNDAAGRESNQEQRVNLYLSYCRGSPVLASLVRHDPLPGARPGEVAGHLHPRARVVGQSRSVRRRCFVTDGLRLILPAYGAYAGGLSIRDAAFAGMVVRAPLVGAIGSKRVHAVGFERVRGE